MPFHMMAVKIMIHSDVVRPFCNEGDVMAWPHGIDGVAGFEVLYLEGSRLALCLRMDEAD